MKAWSKNKIVEIRNPESTRPWQHVLEPISGYLNLAQKLFIDNTLNGESFNFGPIAEQNYTVRHLIKNLSKYWNHKNVDDSFMIANDTSFHEAGMLKLNCDKALHYLKWKPTMNFTDTVKFTSEWYYDFYNTNNNILDKTLEQIVEYENMAKFKGLKWME